MKVLILIACILGLATNAQAHVVDMPVLVNSAQHCWMLLAPAMLAILSPLLRQHR